MKKNKCIIEGKRITCTKCGRAVSTTVPEGTIVRAWIECPECVSKESNLTKDYNWGRVIEEHTIGEYIIIEYHPHKYIDGRGTREIDENKIEYHPYIDNGKENTNRAFNSLDGALLGCMERKHLGLNSQFAHLAIKMLKDEV